MISLILPISPLNKIFSSIKFDLLNQFKGSQNVLLIIDFNDYKENLEFVIDSIKNIGNFTVCILIDAMNIPQIEKIDSTLPAAPNK